VTAHWPRCPPPYLINSSTSKCPRRPAWQCASGAPCAAARAAGGGGAPGCPAPRVVEGAEVDRADERGAGDRGPAAGVQRAQRAGRAQALRAQRGQHAAHAHAARLALHLPPPPRASDATSVLFGPFAQPQLEGADGNHVPLGAHSHLAHMEDPGWKARRGAAAEARVGDPRRRTVSVSSGYSSSCATSPAAPQTASCASALARSLRAAAACHPRRAAGPGRDQGRARRPLAAGAGSAACSDAQGQSSPCLPRLDRGCASALCSPPRSGAVKHTCSTACRGARGQAGRMLAQREAARALQGPACVGAAQELERLSAARHQGKAHACGGPRAAGRPPTAPRAGPLPAAPGARGPPAAHAGRAGRA